MCKLKPLTKRFPEEFRAWIANLTRLYLWRKAGYPIEANDLSFDQWQALALITRYYEVRDFEAIAQRVPQPQQ